MLSFSLGCRGTAAMRACWRMVSAWLWSWALGWHRSMLIASVAVDATISGLVLQLKSWYRLASFCDVHCHFEAAHARRLLLHLAKPDQALSKWALGKFWLARCLFAALWYLLCLGLCQNSAAGLAHWSAFDMPTSVGYSLAAPMSWLYVW